jgi:hypothetical protein
MGVTNTLSKLAQVFMQSEADRTGLTARKTAEAQALQERAMQQAKLRQIMQELELRPAESAAEVDLRQAQAEGARALAGSRETPKPATPHYETDAQGNVVAIVPQPDGTFKATPVGRVGTPQRPSPPSIAIIQGPDGPMRVDRRNPNAAATPIVGADGAPLPPAPTVAQRNAEAGVTAGQLAKSQAKQAAAPILQDLGARITSLNAGSTGGLWSRAGGVVDSLQGKLGMDPAADLYHTGIRGFVPLFARSVGHVGMLTEQDVQRTELLFPRLGESADVTREKLARLNRIMTGQEPVPFQWSQPALDANGITQDSITPEDPTAPPAQPTGLSSSDEALLKKHGY